MLAVEPTAVFSNVGAVVSMVTPFVAVVAVFLAAWANGRVKDRQDEKARDRERHGLLLLVTREIGANGELLRAFSKQPYLIHPTYMPAIRTDAWEDVRAKLAQYVEKDHFGLLDIYYYRLHALQTAVKAYPKFSKDLPKGKAPKEKPQEAWINLAKAADKAGYNAWVRCSQVLGDLTPEPALKSPDSPPNQN